jgi:PAS domain S-box-containing protein
MNKVRDLIIATLSGKNKPLTISEIALISKVDRHAVARNLDTLELLGKVRKIEQGNAKKYYLVTSLPVSGLIDISSDLIMIVDTDLNVQYINTAAEKKLGITTSNLAGERIDLLNADFFSSDEVIEGLKNYSPNKVFRTEITHTDGCIYGVSILGLSLAIGKNLIAIIAEDITGKKQAEQKIIESEEKYKALFNATADPVFVIDPDTGRIIDANPAACRVYGYEHDEMIRLQNTDLSAEPEKTLEATRNFQQYIPLRYHRHKDGRVFPVEFANNLFSLQEKTFILATARDITKRMEIEQALRDSEGILRLIAENIDEAFWMANVDMSKMYYISPSYERIWGCSRESLYESPRSFIDAIHDEDRERIIADLEIKKRGLPFDHEYRIVRPDGTLRNIWDRGFPISDVSGHVSRYVGVATDVTSHKHAEIEIRESEERYHAIFDRSPIAIVLYDSVGGLQHINPAAMKLFGAEDIRDLEDFSLFNAPNLRDEYKNRLKRGETVHFQGPFDFGKIKAGNFFSTCRDGIIWLDVLITPLGDHGKPVTGYLVQIQDIDERKRAEDKLDETAKVLRFLTEVTRHDISNQIADLEQILNSPPDTQARTVIRDCIARARESIKRINKMIEAPP